MQWHARNSRSRQPVNNKDPTRQAKEPCGAVCNNWPELPATWPPLRVRRTGMRVQDDGDHCAITGAVARSLQGQKYNALPLLRPTVVAVFISEAAERCCYYGLLSLLPLFLAAGPTHVSPHIAASATAAFSSAAYATPLLGSWLAGTRIGMFGTISCLSLVYICGMAILCFCASISVPEGTTSAWSGAISLARLSVALALMFIAVGTGGIKPNVAAFGALQVPSNGENETIATVGDDLVVTPSLSTSTESCPRQSRNLPQQQGSLASFFSAFYFLINLGSIFGQTVVPAVQKTHGYPAAFGTAAIVLLSAVLFFLGGEYCTRGGYTHEIHPGNSESISLEPEEVAPDSSCDERPPPRTLTFRRVAMVAWSSRLGTNWLRAERYFDVATCRVLEEPVATVRLLSFASLYWMGYASMGGLWVQQVDQMSLPWGLSASQWTAINPIVVLVGLPLSERVTRGISLHRRMLLGMEMAATAVLISAVMQVVVDRAGSGIRREISGLWTIPQWVLLSSSELLTSITGLELAYTGAGSYAPQLKSALQAIWLLCNAAGAGFAAIVMGGLGAAGAGPGVTLAVLGAGAVGGAILFSQNAPWEARNTGIGHGGTGAQRGHTREQAPLVSAA